MTAVPEFDCIVVGSGPSGVACASALLAAGRSVLMVDAGVSLEPERAALVETARERRDISADTAAWAVHEAREGLPRKLIYGSEFPYGEASEQLGLARAGVGVEPSFAVGGLSNVWGAAALPFVQHDIADWPITEAQLAPHYAACSDMLGISAAEDDLAEWLPLYAKPRAPLERSAQASAMHQSLSRNREALRAAGFRFGQTRVAVAAEDCLYCGLCLHGCPRKLIYAAPRTLQALQANPRFAYRSNVVVEGLSEDAACAFVTGKDRLSAEPVALHAKRAFLAAGALPTTALLMRAGALDRAILKDSQYFLLPLLFLKGASKPSAERLHTMAQLFLELRDAAISPHTVHMQVYTYNDHMAHEVRRRLGPLSFAAPLADARLGLIQGYLHSAHSGAIELSLENGGLHARGQASAEARSRLGKLIGKLLTAAPKLGAAPVWPLLEIAEPGRGFHVGGSFPMSAAPQGASSDTLGRPFGSRRIHAVDASVLPSIPATTITFAVMANAHRIGAEAARDEA